MNLRILLLIIFLVMTGCITVEVCDESYDSELVARFKTLKNNEPADTTVNALTLYGIREGLSDSLLYDSVAATGFMVPLDPHHDYSRFVIEINGQTDTLTISHQNELYLISYTCGFANLFIINNIETTSDSSMILDAVIENDLVDAEYETNEQHIWLYL
jgi:hypothetical protein